MRCCAAYTYFLVLWKRANPLFSYNILLITMLDPHSPTGEMSDDPLCQEQTPDDATNQCCVVVYCSSQDEDYYSEDDTVQPTSPGGGRLPESVLKQVDLSAKPADGSDEFLQVSC